ncbi:hypothetical protein L195_g042934 [Trifolium pratense]|uniref:Uncharacterized protein n=1 Tax=Trifolium pratense TaxID=57577 RepID=A0A2K3M7S3_TRIPR|nr:hypothetical protein L195_g042934 [Trifolium pratense]
MGLGVTPSTRSVYALSPFEHYQAETDLDETESWKTTNKTIYRGEQSKLDLTAGTKTTKGVNDVDIEATKQAGTTSLPLSISENFKERDCPCIRDQWPIAVVSTPIRNKTLVAIKATSRVVSADQKTDHVPSNKKTDHVPKRLCREPNGLERTIENPTLHRDWMVGEKEG